MTRKKKETQFAPGDIVYLRTDPDKNPRIIVGYKGHPSGWVKFKVAFGSTFSKHFEFELEREVPKRAVIKGLKPSE